MSAFYNSVDFTVSVEVEFLPSSFWGKMLSENHNALRKDLVTRST